MFGEAGDDQPRIMLEADEAVLGFDTQPASKASGGSAGCDAGHGDRFDGTELAWVQRGFRWVRNLLEDEGWTTVCGAGRKRKVPSTLKFLVAVPYFSTSDSPLVREIVDTIFGYNGKPPLLWHGPEGVTAVQGVWLNHREQLCVYCP
jgi:hypothetical protein